jgi:Leucine-rich repeat (LRR) protein
MGRRFLYGFILALLLSTCAGQPVRPTLTPSAPPASTAPIAKADETVAPTVTPTSTPSPSPQAKTGPFTTCDAVHDIPAEECQALVAFYKDSSGQIWVQQDGWLSTDVPCTWLGVSCTAGHVTGLELIGNGLSGPIPLAVTRLPSLETLNLTLNALMGEIPYQLERLTNLHTLRLRDNRLEGSIPPELGRLSQLRILNLDTNRLSGDIPVELTDLSNLEVLVLANNDLTGGLPPELGKLAHLRLLSVGGNTALSGELPTTLTHLKLEAFGFSNTKLCEPSDAAFQQWLTSIATLARTTKCGHVT